jgi:hypothetical protein
VLVRPEHLSQSFAARLQVGLHAIQRFGVSYQIFG